MKRKLTRALEILNEEGPRSLFYAIQRDILNRAVLGPIGTLQKPIFRRIYDNGVDVIKEDWDNLIILDACRYDYFVQHNSLDGRLEAVISQGGHSWEFMEENFLGRRLHDTVYVTANPHAERLPKNLFYTIENILDRWDEEYETVLPSEVASAAIDAHEEYPNKRLIIHFMQPHEPWLGPTMENILERVNVTGYDKEYAKKSTDKNIDGMNVWQAVRLGIIDQAEMKQAYRESLDIVLQEVDKLINDIDGKTVITSDHGELLGDRVFPLTPRLYGHPHTIYTKSLCKVPWLVISTNNHRKTIAEEPIGYQRLDEDTINDRLQALGYAPE